MAAARPQQFFPQNPDKYAGDPRKIIARSSWELIYMRALDQSPLVSKWVSEPKFLNISYMSPIDKRVKQYWPDFLIVYVSGEKELVEIKPLKEASLREAKTDYDKLMFAQNVMKWQAAQKVAAAIGAKFRLVTEAQLFVPKTRQPQRAKTSRSTVKPLRTVKPRGTRK